MARKIPVLAALSAAVLLSAGCNEWGLPGKNRPFAEAASREWRYPLYEKSPAMSKPFVVDGRTWQTTGAFETMSSSMLSPVATVNGTQIFALRSDATPFDRLYSANPDGRYSVIIGN